MQITHLIMLKNLGDSLLVWTEVVWMFLVIVYVNGYVSAAVSFTQL